MTTTGLSSRDAAQRLLADGPNSIGVTQRHNVRTCIRSTIQNPLLLALIAIAVTLFVLGEQLNALVIGAMVAVSLIMDAANSFYATRAARRLAARVRTTARVMRDGHEQSLPLERIVVGDCIILTAGTLVPADAVVIDSRDLFVDQSALTGESYPVEKTATTVPAESPTNAPGHPSPDDPRMLFLGTSIVSGHGIAHVIATGRHTTYGAIAQNLTQPPAVTAYEHGIAQFSRFIMQLVAFLVVAVAIARLSLGGELLETLTFAIAIAIGLTPELLPVMLSVSLARGSMVMARKNVIVKRLAAIHNFGSMTVLCTDKTGTLTEGRIELVKHLDINGETSRDVFLYSYLNSTFHTGVRHPLDAAVIAHGHPDITNYTPVDEVPFDFERRRDSMVVAHGDTHTMITKGSPEAILAVSTLISEQDTTTPLTDKHRHRVDMLHAALNRDGYRVLGIAVRPLSSDDPLINKDDECSMIFLGLIAFRDPPKKSARTALDTLEALGVNIKIITGDSDTLTQKICADVDIPVMGTLTGEDIDCLSDEALSERVHTATIFARTTPEQKQRVIRALKQRDGSVVGFLGDGINDALALRAADIGISVNNAVDVAKDAADIILMRSDLKVLADGIAVGRTTFANTTTYLLLWLSSNFGNMISMLATSLFLPFLPMTPQQILLNNFLYDLSQTGLPTDTVSPSAIRRPPRWNFDHIRRFIIVFSPLSPLFDILTFIVLFGIFSVPTAAFQTSWFLVSITTQALVVFVVRARTQQTTRPSRILLVTTGGVIACAWALPFLSIGSIFTFTPPSLSVVITLLAVTAAYIGTAFFVKNWFFRRMATEA